MSLLNESCPVEPSKLNAYGFRGAELAHGLSSLMYIGDCLAYIPNPSFIEYFWCVDPPLSIP